LCGTASRTVSTGLIAEKFTSVAEQFLLQYFITVLQHIKSALKFIVAFIPDKGNHPHMIDRQRADTEYTRSARDVSGE